MIAYCIHSGLVPYSRVLGECFLFVITFLSTFDYTHLLLRKDCMDTNQVRIDSKLGGLAAEKMISLKLARSNTIKTLLIVAL